MTKSSMVKSSSIPDRWEWVTLESACDINLGQSPPSSTYNEDGQGLPFFQGKAEFGDLYPEPVKWCSKPQKVAKEGDVLISVRAPVGATNLNPFKSCIGRGLAALRPKAGMSNRYFLYLLRHIRQELEDKATGTTFQAITGSVLRSQRIPLAPLSEQERIVDEIEKQFTRLDAAIAYLKRIQANLERYKASVLKAACEGRLVPQEADLNPDYEPAEKLLERILEERRRRWEEEEWQKHVERAKKKVEQARRKEAGLPYYFRDMEPEDWMEVPEEEYGDYLPKSDKWKEKYEEPEPPDADELPELPEGWVWARAEQICDWITKGTTPNARKLFDGEGEVPFIKVYNLTFNGTLDFGTEPTFVARATHLGELSRSRVFPGDVLMNIVGPPLGKVSIVPEKYPEWNINQAIAIFRPMLSFDNKFLAYILMSDNILAWVKHQAKATAGQFNLTLAICRDLLLPIPPLSEQRRIVEEIERRLTTLKSVRISVDADNARAVRLRQSILQQAFSGKLVPNDPSDEPASTLLARIRDRKDEVAVQPSLPLQGD